jgi:thioesterase domain-containing protein
MFTSGSTGGPKGVLIPHSGIVNYLQWLRSRDWLRPGDRIVFKTPHTFDVSVSEIFWPLATGATLVVAPDELHRDPVALAAFLTEQRVGHACFVPSMLDAFLAAVDAVPACLTEVYCAGEALRTSTVRQLRSLSAARVHNMYGPTEASIIGTAHVIPAGEPADAPDIPIGRPVDNTQALILDADLNLVPDGVPGHLHLGGAGLAYGYAGQPATTAGQFVPNPYARTPGGRLYRTGDLARRRSDGDIEYLGRSDNQIKIGGVRIEPSEIESVLLSHPSVRAAVVVARTAGNHTRLVAYVAGMGEPDAIRAHAAAWLPPLLVPSAVVVLPELPLTGSGKVDRRALPETAQAVGPTTFVPPRTPVETALVRVWEAELGIVPIGIEDAFLDRGGHSLAAMRIAIRLRQEHGLAVSPVQIMSRRTIAAVAATIDRPPSIAEVAGAGDLPSAAPVPDQPAPPTPRRTVAGTAGSDAPVPSQDGPIDRNMVWMRESPGAPALFCVHPGGGSAHWYEELAANLPGTIPVAAFHHPGVVDPADATCSTEHLARRYLRQLVAAQPDGPYQLFGWCGGAPIAWEMAGVLRTRGAQVTLVLLDPVLQDDTSTVRGGENLQLLTDCDVAYAELKRETEPARQQRLRERIAELLDDILIGGHGNAGTAATDEVWPVAVRSWRLQLETRLSYRYRAAPVAVQLLACDELAGGIHEGLAGLTFTGYLDHWRALATEGVQVHRVRGGNTTSMLPPYVAALGALVGQLLAEPGR